VTRGHLVLGRDADLIRETEGGIEIVSRVRLRPGFMVLVISPTGIGQPRSRSALVTSWWIRAVGSDGTTYRGFCRWDSSQSPALPAGPGGGPENGVDR